MNIYINRSCLPLTFIHEKQGLIRPVYILYILNNDNTYGVIQSEGVALTG